MAQRVKSLPAMWVRKIPWRRKWQPTPVFLPGKSSWTEEPGGLQSVGSQRVGHNWETSLPLSTILSLHRYSKRNESIYVHTKNCTKIFIVALFIIASVHHPWWIDKCTVEWYMAIETTGSYYNIDEPWKHYAKWKKPGTKDHMLYDSNYMKCAK